MIGMIALAGIIVRNSILLVDFIKQQVAAGMDFARRRDPVRRRARQADRADRRWPPCSARCSSSTTRSSTAWPSALIFGILVSTLLTLVVIPVLYFSAFRKEHQ